eukprot:TRINITY_DN1040_c0_g1_i11.p6 TRINITY_DN1040_c0_g1~~TRINITY_DN1040_c0_g1_i11.p6  ORF type:complete len:102 (+),score=0.84 TRINITY_DN1040_c0_g1_i11:988-1293(+)
MLKKKQNLDQQTGIECGLKHNSYNRHKTIQTSKHRILTSTNTLQIQLLTKLQLCYVLKLVNNQAKIILKYHTFTTTGNYLNTPTQRLKQNQTIKKGKNQQK